jgi:hypothetical protein
VIIHYISVGLEVERIEETSPPIGANVFFEVWDGTKKGEGFTVAAFLRRLIPFRG